MLRLLGLVLVSAMTTLLAVPAAYGRQAKPDPVPQKPPEDPVPDVAAWSRAYEQAGRPTVMLLCGIDAGVGDVKDGPKWNFELEGEPAQIVSAFEEILDPGANPIDVVDFNAFKRMQGRFENVLKLNGEEEAVNLLREELKAELLITIRITQAQPLPKVVVAASEEARGRRGFTVAFDWKGDFSAREIKANIRAVAKRFIEDFVGRAEQQVLSMTIRIMGAKREWLREMRDVLGGLGGVKSAKMRNVAGGPNDQVAEFDIRYESSENVNDLLFDACDALAERIDAEAATELAQGNTAVIRMRPKPPPPPERIAHNPTCLEQIKEVVHAGDPNTTNAAKEQLIRLYKSKGVPKTTILLNRRATPSEIREAEKAESEGRGGDVGTMVVVTGMGSAIGTAGNPGDQPDAAPGPGTTQEQGFRDVDKYEMFARSLEDAMSNLLGIGALKFTMIEPMKARDSLIHAAQKQTTVMGEAELSALILGLEVADVYVIGYATNPMESGSNVQFSFKAVTANGEIIGYGQKLFTQSFTLGPEFILPIAEDIVSQLACGIIESWKPPSRITIKLLGAMSLDDFAFMRDAIDDAGRQMLESGGQPEIRLFGTEQFDRSTGQGVVVFRIEFDNERVPATHLFERLRALKEAAEKDGKAPFPIFDAEKKDDTMIEIRIRPSAGDKAP